MSTVLNYELTKDNLYSLPNSKKIELKRIQENINQDPLNDLLISQYTEHLIKILELGDKLLNNDFYLNFIKKGKSDFFNKDFIETLDEAVELTKTKAKKIVTDNLPKDIQELIENKDLDVNDIINLTAKNTFQEIDKNKDSIVKQILSKNLINLSSEIKDKGLKKVENILKSAIDTQIKDFIKLFDENIFSIIAQSISKIDKKEVTKIEKSLLLLKKIENESDKIKIEETKKVFNNLWGEGNTFESNKILYKSNLEKVMFNLNKLNAMKNIFGPLFQSKNIKKIIMGNGSLIISNILFKITSDNLMNQLFRLNTDSSLLLKDSFKENENYNDLILKKLLEIKTSGEINKDIAVANILLNIEQTNLNNDLSFVNKIIPNFKKQLKPLYKKIIKLVDKLEGKDDEIENFKKELENFPDKIIEKIDKKVDAYIELSQEFNIQIEEKLETIMSIEETYEGIVEDFKENVEIDLKNINTMIDNIDKLDNAFNNRIKKINDFNLKIEEIDIQIKTIVEIIDNLEEQLKDVPDIDSKYILLEEIDKYENILNLFKSKKNDLISINEKMLNLNNKILFELAKKSFDTIQELKSSPEKWKDFQDNILNEIEELKNIVDVSKEIKVTTNILDNLKKDAKELIDFPDKLKDSLTKKGKDFLEIDSVTDIKTRIEKIFGIVEDSGKYLNNKKYLENISEVLKRYGYKDTVIEYVKELNKTLDIKLKSYEIIVHKTRYLQAMMEYVDSNFKEYSKNHNRKDVSKILTKQIKELIFDIELEKKKLISNLIENTNNDRKDITEEIDQEITDLLNNEPEVKEEKIFQNIYEEISQLKGIKNYKYENNKLILKNNPDYSDKKLEYDNITDNHMFRVVIDMEQSLSRISNQYSTKEMFIESQDKYHELLGNRIESKFYPFFKKIRETINKIGFDIDLYDKQWIDVIDSNFSNKKVQSIINSIKKEIEGQINNNNFYHQTEEEDIYNEENYLIMNNRKEIRKKLDLKETLYSFNEIFDKNLYSFIKGENITNDNLNEFENNIYNFINEFQIDEYMIDSNIKNRKNREMRKELETFFNQIVKDFKIKNNLLKEKRIKWIVEHINNKEGYYREEEKYIEQGMLIFLDDFNIPYTHDDLSKKYSNNITNIIKNFNDFVIQQDGTELNNIYQVATKIQDTIEKLTIKMEIDKDNKNNYLLNINSLITIYNSLKKKFPDIFLYTNEMFDNNKFKDIIFTKEEEEMFEFGTIQELEESKIKLKDFNIELNNIEKELYELTLEKHTLKDSPAEIIKKEKNRFQIKFSIESDRIFEIDNKIKELEILKKEIQNNIERYDNNIKFLEKNKLTLNIIDLDIKEIQNSLNIENSKTEKIKLKIKLEDLLKTRRLIVTELTTRMYDDIYLSNYDVQENKHLYRIEKELQLSFKQTIKEEKNGKTIFYSENEKIENYKNYIENNNINSYDVNFLNKIHLIKLGIDLLQKKYKTDNRKKNKLDNEFIDFFNKTISLIFKRDGIETKRDFLNLHNDISNIKKYQSNEEENHKSNHLKLAIYNSFFSTIKELLLDKDNFIKNIKRIQKDFPNENITIDNNENSINLKL